MVLWATTTIGMVRTHNLLVVRQNSVILTMTHTFRSNTKKTYWQVNIICSYLSSPTDWIFLVSTDIENKAAWKECFSVAGVKLPTGYYIGLSASTGDLSDNHDIHSIRFYELDLPEDVNTEDRSQISPSATYFEPPRDHVDDPKPSSLGGFKLFLLMLIGALAVITCVVLGIMFYQQQQQTRKRLY